MRVYLLQLQLNIVNLNKNFERQLNDILAEQAEQHLV